MGTDFVQAWHDALADGVVPNTASAKANVTLRSDAEFQRPPAPPDHPLTVLFRPDPHLWDGRYANNAWRRSEIAALLASSTVQAFGELLRLLCRLLTSPPRSRALRPAQSGLPDTPEISRGKIDRLRRTPAGFTTPVLDGRGLRDHLLARPAG